MNWTVVAGQGAQLPSDRYGAAVAHDPTSDLIYMFGVSIFPFLSRD